MFVVFWLGRTIEIVVTAYLVFKCSYLFRLCTNYTRLKFAWAHDNNFLRTRNRYLQHGNSIQSDISKIVIRWIVILCKCKSLDHVTNLPFPPPYPIDLQLRTVTNFTVEIRSAAINSISSRSSRIPAIATYIAITISAIVTIDCNSCDCCLVACNSCDCKLVYWL